MECAVLHVIKTWKLQAVHPSISVAMKYLQNVFTTLYGAFLSNNRA